MAARSKKSKRKKAHQPPKKPRPTTLPTLADVCQAPKELLAGLDVGALNLMCAGGLPGAQNLKITKILQWLDDAAAQVELATRRHWYRFLVSPDTYNRSPGYFCCYFLLQVLQEDFGVKYNPARVRDPSFQGPKCLDPDFRDSRDLFIHGIIDGPGGTCVSMPVLYVAVGRRLGYPLKLVETRGHLFFRWDDPNGERLGLSERFNVEGAGEGIHSYSDDHYRTWSEADEAGGWYLRSLSPTEELASFLATRAECLTDNGRRAEAIQAYQWACGLAPNDFRYRSQLAKLDRLNHHEILEIEEMLAFSRAARERNKDRSLPAAQGQPTHAPPAHGVSCQCIDCRKAHAQNEAERNMPPHGGSCKCFHCQSARERTIPGHPHGCRCGACLQLSGGTRQSTGAMQPWKYR